MEQEIKEVNTPGALSGNDEKDEVIIPAVDENNVIDEEKKDSPELSVSSTDDEKDSLKSKEPKPVEGETAKETALRLQIERKNAIIRKLSKTRGNIFYDLRQEEVKEHQEAKENLQNVSVSKNILEEKGYTENEIENAKILISELAPQLGFIKAEQVYKNTAQQIFDAFIEQHSEYAEQYDEEDVRFNTYKEILFNDYNIKNKNPRELEKIFNKVHRDVNDVLGEAKIESNKDEEGEMLAKKQKINSISHSGGTQSPTAKLNKTKIDTSKPIGGVMFKGFGEDDF